MTDGASPSYLIHQLRLRGLTLGRRGGVWQIRRNAVVIARASRWRAITEHAHRILKPDGGDKG